MRKVLLSMAIAVGLAGQALGADSTDQPAMTSFAWTGGYAGLQAGYGWGDATYKYNPFDSTTEFDTDGFIGGLTVGYNWQRGQIVLGVEGDFSLVDISGSIDADTAPCFVGQQGCTSELNWFGTARLRAGYAVGNLLPYMTGGLALGSVKGTADFGACGSDPCGYDKTKAGWTLGGGVEWAMNEKLSFKAEYLHIDLGDPGIAPNASGQFDGSDVTFDTVRLGVNYHF